MICHKTQRNNQSRYLLRIKKKLQTLIKSIRVNSQNIRTAFGSKNVSCLSKKKEKEWKEKNCPIRKASDSWREKKKQQIPGNMRSGHFYANTDAFTYWQLHRCLCTNISLSALLLFLILLIQINLFLADIIDDFVSLKRFAHITTRIISSACG